MPVPLPRPEIWGALFLGRIAILLAIFFALTQVASAQFLLSARPTPPVRPVALGPAKTESSTPLWAPLKPEKELAAYVPITPRQRLRWFIANTIAPLQIVGGVFSSSLGMAVDRPKEYGTHWDGFADRFGMRLTGIVPGSAMEAGLGYILKEDPRYFSARGLPWKPRFFNVIRLTFVARRDDGSYGPAYARYAAIAGNNLLSNAWRPGSEANLNDALLRMAEGFAERMADNAFEEFWPSAKKHIFHRGD